MQRSHLEVTHKWLSYLVPQWKGKRNFKTEKNINYLEPENTVGCIYTRQISMSLTKIEMVISSDTTQRVFYHVI